jgi:hypothetical protein
MARHIAETDSRAGGSPTHPFVKFCTMTLASGKPDKSALNAFDLPCKWLPEGYIQGVSVAFIPKNG